MARLGGAGRGVSSRCGRSGHAPLPLDAPGGPAMAATATGRDVCGALLTWLQTFAPPSPCASPQDLASGVTLAHALHSIDSSWFNETWLGQIRDDAEDNWRLKVSNLRKVLQSVLEYWQDVLGQAVGEQHVPDVALAAQHADPEQLGKLVRLVLGCAVSCEKREEHIQRIMGLEESVQHVVMTAIQELLDKEPAEVTATDTYGNFDTQSRRYYFLSEDPEDPGGQQQQLVLQLEQQVALLREERGSLAEENRALREAKEQLEAEAEAAGAKRLQLLQAQLEQLQEENYRLESGKEELVARCSRLEREARGLQARAEQLSSLAGEAQALRDEMDALRASSARAGRLEAALGALRGRAGQAGQLRRWVRALEEQNRAQQRRARDLEEQLERERAASAGLEAARRQVAELSGQRAAAAAREQRWREELRGLRERLEALGQEKERLQEERDALREANEELRCAQEQQSCLRQAGAVLDAAPVPNLAAEILPMELRETVSRLQQENRRLQEQEATLRLQRDQLHRQLRLETPWATELGMTPSDPPEEVEPKPLAPPAALQALRNQLQEKDALIRHLESDRAQREREERLLVTAWYSMGLAVQQKDGEGWGSRGPPGGAQSFLAQQRLATVARRARPPHGRPPNR